MDEPLSNLDAKLRLEMRYELQRLHVETGSTFVYVTHDQMEAMTLATKICLINNGVLQQYAAPLTVYNAPSNLFVADFVGNPSINFIEAKGNQEEETVALSILNKIKVKFQPSQEFSVINWQKEHRKEETAEVEKHRLKLKDKNYVEKGNKDEVFRYHIAKVKENDFTIQEEPVITDEDFVLGVRPEFIKISDEGALEGVIYGAMPTGMESTVKIRIGDFLLTAVIFGGVTYQIGSTIRFNISSEQIMLFERQSGRYLCSGNLLVIA